MKTALALALLIAAVAAANVNAAPTVKVRLKNEMTSFFVEGYVSFVRLDRTKWRRVRGSSISVAASPGRHVVHAFIRPCDANCSNLDAPERRCAAVVRRGQVATYHLRDDGCMFTVRG